MEILQVTHNYTLGGAVRQSAIYVKRSLETVIVGRCRSGALTTILASRQMGKSSLLTWLSRELTTEGYLAVYLDLSSCTTGSEAPGLGETWFARALEKISHVAGLSERFEEWRVQKEEIEPTVLEEFLEHVLFDDPRARNQGVVLLFDEIDSLIGKAWCEEFCYKIKSVIDLAASVQGAWASRLGLVLAGVARPNELVRDPRRGPFNVGPDEIVLHGFVMDEARVLTEDWVCPESVKREILERVLFWTGGHPYLTVRLCAHVYIRPNSWNSAGVDQAIKEVFFSSNGDIFFDTIVKRLLAPLAAVSTASLLYRYRQIARGVDVPIDPLKDEHRELLLSGIVTDRGDRVFRVSNRLIAEKLSPRWAAKKLLASTPLGRFWNMVSRDPIWLRTWLSISLFISLCLVLGIFFALELAERENALAVAEAKRAKAEAEKALALAEAETEKAETEIAKAEAEKAKTEKALALAETRKAKAETGKAETEKALALAETEKAKAEAGKAETEKALALTEAAKARAEAEKAETEKALALARTETAMAETRKAETERGADRALRALLVAGQILRGMRSLDLSREKRRIRVAEKHEPELNKILDEETFFRTYASSFTPLLLGLVESPPLFDLTSASYDFTAMNRRATLAIASRRNGEVEIYDITNGSAYCEHTKKRRRVNLGQFSEALSNGVVGSAFHPNANEAFLITAENRLLRVLITSDTRAEVKDLGERAVPIMATSGTTGSKILALSKDRRRVLANDLERMDADAKVVFESTTDDITSFAAADDKLAIVSETEVRLIEGGLKVCTRDFGSNVVNLSFPYHKTVDPPAIVVALSNGSVHILNSDCTTRDRLLLVKPSEGEDPGDPEEAVSVAYYGEKPVLLAASDRNIYVWQAEAKKGKMTWPEPFRVNLRFIRLKAAGHTPNTAEWFMRSTYLWDKLDRRYDASSSGLMNALRKGAEEARQCSNRRTVKAKGGH